MKSLETVIGPVKLRNPFILTSGVLGSTYSTLNRAYREGFGAVTTKSFGLEPRSGYQNPTVIYLPEIKSVINAVGLANPGCVKYSEELNALDPGVKFIASVFGSSQEELVSVIECFEKHSSKEPVAYELNLSCPHARKAGMAVGTDPETVTGIVSGVKKATKTPVWVKLTPNITNIIPIGEAAVSAGADAIVAINTVKAMIIDIRAKKPVLANLRGGLSGKAIKPVGVRIIYDLYERFGPEVPLVGIGGISSWEDVIEYLLAGACAVQLGTILTDYPSPGPLISELSKGLKEYLAREDCSLKELRGLAHEQ
ncbi:MAG: dihydroorotate dehydrogenase [Candidatus Odinarchaeota archaeon]